VRDLPPGCGGKGTISVKEVQASGGIPPISGRPGLPDGLTSRRDTGIISGPPQTPGTFTFTIWVTDSVRPTCFGSLPPDDKRVHTCRIAASGLPARADPASQPQFKLSFASPFPVALSGQVGIDLGSIPAAGDRTSSSPAADVLLHSLSQTGIQRPCFRSRALQPAYGAGHPSSYVQLRHPTRSNPLASAFQRTARVERAAPKFSSIKLVRSSCSVTIRLLASVPSREKVT